MPGTPEPTRRVRPFVHEGGSFKSLHFSIREIQSRMSCEDPCALDLEHSRTMMGCADCGNSIVFAFKPPRLPLRRAGGLRAPRHLDEGAARQLAAGFALIVTALEDERR